MTSLSRAQATLNVPFRFSAWHSLPSRPERHEHTFQVTVALRGAIAPETGMVIDILKVQPLLEELRAPLEGQMLNGLAVLGDAPAPVNLAAKYPTCETLARYFAWALERRLASLGASDAKLVSVTVQLDDQSQELGHAVLALD
jgi:6-pyruvoyl-tetrahydropterin synthase